MSPRVVAIRVRRRLEAPDRVEAQRIGERAQIDGEHHAAGNDVDRPRQRLDAADGADHAVLGMLARDRFQRQRHFGRARAARSRRRSIGTVPA